MNMDWWCNDADRGNWSTRRKLSWCHLFQREAHRNGRTYLLQQISPKNRLSHGSAPQMQLNFYIFAWRTKQTYGCCVFMLQLLLYYCSEVMESS